VVEEKIAHKIEGNLKQWGYLRGERKRKRILNERKLFDVC